MFEELHTVHHLDKNGKLDTGLKLRLALFMVLTITFGIIVLYDIFFKGVIWYSLILPFVIGLPFGYFLLSKTNDISWDRKRRVMKVGQIDMAGFVILGLYWAVRLGGQYLLVPFYHNVLTISGASFSMLFGIMVGRLVAVFRKIHDVHENR